MIGSGILSEKREGNGNDGAEMIDYDRGIQNHIKAHIVIAWFVVIACTNMTHVTEIKYCFVS